MKTFLCPFPLEVDAYQAGHELLIPPGMENGQVSQTTYRKQLIQNDRRVISAGLLPFVKLELENLKITKDDIKIAKEIYSTFHAHLQPPYYRPYHFPENMFNKIVDEFDGRLPIVLTGLPDGTAHYIGEPCTQVWTNVPGMGELVGWVESSLLPYNWAMSTVATRGRIRKDNFIKVYKDCHPDITDQELLTTIQYKFHDFGRRGGMVSQMTGIAHLMNFLGTDTMDAVYAAMLLNNGLSFGAASIMAAAHRTITPWLTEDDAYANQIPQFADTLQSVVCDTYNYEGGVRKIAEYHEIVKQKGGLLVARPDSGDPVECVIKGLQILDSKFGHVNRNGLRILNNAAIIQGDGINDENIFGSKGILKAVIEEGYSPLNVAFGMGENNHSCTRSMLEAGYKTCLNMDASGKWKPSMKWSDSPFKRSFPCAVDIDTTKIKNKDNRDYTNRVIRLSPEDMIKNNLKGYKVFYDGRPEQYRKDNECEIFIDNFCNIRERTFRTWNELDPQPGCDTVSKEIRMLQEEYMKDK